MAKSGITIDDRLRSRAFLSMLVMVPLGGAATDIYIPSLPAMESCFHADRFAIQATLLIFMAGYGVGQIVAGPLTDSFGRRVPILLSTILFVLASAGIALAPPLSVVIALRAAQGILVACSAVGARAIIADCCDGAERIKVANWMTIAQATGQSCRLLLAAILRRGLAGQPCSGSSPAEAWSSLSLSLPCCFCRKPAPMNYDSRSARHLASTAPWRWTLSICRRPWHGLSDIGDVRVRGPGAVLHPGRPQAQPDLLRPPAARPWLPVARRQFFRSAHQSALQGDPDHHGRGRDFASGQHADAGLDLSGIFSVVALVVPAGIIYFLMAMIWPNGYSKCLGRFPHAGGSANALVSGLSSSSVLVSPRSPHCWNRQPLGPFGCSISSYLRVPRHISSCASPRWSSSSASCAASSTTRSGKVGLRPEPLVVRIV